MAKPHVAMTTCASTNPRQTAHALTVLTCADLSKQNTPPECPLEPSCEPRNWSSEEACRLLTDSTIHFIGDSFVRHVYTALLLVIRGDVLSGAIKANTSERLRSRCSGIYMFSEKVCRQWLDSNTTACQGTVSLRFVHATRASHVKIFQQAVFQLQDRPRSFAFFGMGLHNDLNTSLIWEVVRPILEVKVSQKWSWPRLLWAGVHGFGMMRTPVTTVDNKAVFRFNQDMKQLLGWYHVPVFDTYSFVHNVMSFDGLHYGYGVNSVKANILLHYFQELTLQKKW